MINASPLRFPPRAALALLLIASGPGCGRRDSVAAPNPPAVETPASPVQPETAPAGPDTNTSASADATPGAADFRALKSLLPDNLAGLKRSAVSGQHTRLFGLEVAQVSARYGDPAAKRIDININDAGTLSGLASLIGQAWAMVEFERENENGFERTLRVAGNPGYQRFDHATGSGEITMLVEDRFIVSVHAEQAGLEDLMQAFGGIDLAALMALKAAGSAVP
jgi:hypothetical protein